MLNTILLTVAAAMITFAVLSSQPAVYAYSLNTHHHVADNKTSNKKNVFICITGQTSRVELRNKIKYLFKPLHELGYAMHIATVLSNGSRYSLEDNGARVPLQLSILKIKHALKKVDGVQSVRNIMPNFANMSLNHAYNKTLDCAMKRNCAENNARMYYTMQYCYHGYNISGLTAFAIRIRDDLMFVKMDLKRAIKEVLEGKLVTSTCDAWHGINDKMAFIPSNKAKDYFLLPYRTYLTFNVSDVPVVEDWPYLNSEQFFKFAYNNSIRMKASDALVVTKAVTSRARSSKGLSDSRHSCRVKGNPFQKYSNCPGFLSMANISYTTTCYPRFK